MITIAVLVVVALGILYAIASPVLTYTRYPWQFDAPNSQDESLRQEQIMALDALRDLAMDYRMGQLTEEDYRSLAAPLQRRAKQTLEHQIGQPTSDVDAGLLALDADLEASILSLRVVEIDQKIAPAQSTLAAQFCTQCGEKTESSFRFCGFCGASLPTVSTSTISTSTVSTLSTTEAEVDDVHDASPVLESLDAESPAAESLASKSVLASSSTASSSTGDSKPAQPDVSDSANRVESIAPSTPSIRRWWIISAVVAAIWIAVIVIFYLNSRAGLESQVPVRTLSDGPVVTMAATIDQTLVSSINGLHVATDLDAWSQPPTDDILLSITPLAEPTGSWFAAGVDGLWRTMDNGGNWTQIDVQPVGTTIRLVASKDDGTIWGADEQSLFFSEDQGVSWTRVDSVLPGNVRALATGPNDIFIGTNQGVFRSTDQGESWIDSNSVVNGRIGSTDIQALAYDEEGGNLFAGTPLGLYFLNLENVGGWGRRTLDADVRSLAIPAGANNILWLGTANGEVFYSTNRGVTWRN